jgi:outer membrane protein OmpA-like peptidoglycan-associated protein
LEFMSAPGLRPTVAALACLAVLMACTTNPYTGERQLSRTALGGLLGAAGGAGLGAGIGALAGRDAAKGAMIGAGVGALAGGAVGAYMDVQEAKLRQQLAGTGVGVTRVGDELVLRMPGNVTFESNRSEIRSSFYEVLNSVGLVLVEYDKTIVEVSGHTDSTGSDAYNQTLSEKRAQSVGDFLASRGIDRRRLLTQGLGEQYPVADNATPEGREQNRRVELRLVPLTA